VPEGPNRKHRAEHYRSRTTNRHNCRQRRRLPRRDCSQAAQHEYSIDQTRTAFVRLTEDGVQQLVEFVTTLIKIAESYKRTRPRRNDHCRTKVEIGSRLTHTSESMRAVDSSVEHDARLLGGCASRLNLAQHLALSTW
jgi:hypothetical protein